MKKTKKKNAKRFIATVLVIGSVFLSLPIQGINAFGEQSQNDENKNQEQSTYAVHPDWLVPTPDPSVGGGTGGYDYKMISVHLILRRIIVHFNKRCRI